MNGSGTAAEAWPIEWYMASVDSELDGFLREKSSSLALEHMPYITDVLRGFLSGGKRIRPRLCFLGWEAAGGQGRIESVVSVAAALEMFHAFALIHDDVMDESDVRRGNPTVHRELTRFGVEHGHPQAERFGNNGAVLLGDLALAWSDELFFRVQPDSGVWELLTPLLSSMRTEVMVGQYLDLCGTGTLSEDVEKALTVARFKTAKYTIERPLQVGAVLGGGEGEVLAACSEFAMPLGEAFQMRDDLLGVFGATEETGKSRLDDLRDGKSTALTAFGLRLAAPAQRERLRELIGKPDIDDREAAEVREILRGSGALGAVEKLIEDRYALALKVLDEAPFRERAGRLLREMARNAIERKS